jgi:hypothetical protein
MFSAIHFPIVPRPIKPILAVIELPPEKKYIAAVIFRRTVLRLRIAIENIISATGERKTEKAELA